MQTQMHGSHQAAYDALFQHPIARNLQWRELRSMLSSLSNDVEDEQNGNVKFTRNGQTLSVRPPRGKDFSDAEALMHIRRFLEQSDDASPATIASGIHLLVVIDHREARIFKTELHGSVPERITPFDPSDSRSHRHLHNVDNNANGQRKPELKTFYEAVAKKLSGAEKILILGAATGSSSAMDFLLAELKQHHPEIAKKVVGSIVVNEQHLTEDQMLAEARTFYATRPL